jgi:transcriptional regulator with XRE-family HTH domain
MVEISKQKEFSELLKRLRGKLSLREAAKKTGLSHTYISALEKGYNTNGEPTALKNDTIYKLSVGYNYPYVELMKIAGQTPLKMSNSLDILNQETELKFGDITLTEEQKKKLINMIQTFFVDK